MDRPPPARAGRRANRSRHRDVHDLRGSVAAVLPPPGQRSDRAPGRRGVVELITGLRREDVRGNLERVREQIADAGRDPREVEILAAVKYVPVDELQILADAG